MRSLAVWTLALAAAAGLGWWVLLLVEPRAGSWFLPADVEPLLIRTFIVPDFVFFVAAPAAASFGLRRGRPWGWPVLCVHTGGVLYAALWGWGLFTTTGAGLYGVLLMTPPAVLFAYFTWRLRPGA